MREIKYKYWDFKDKKMSIMGDNGVLRTAYKSESNGVWQDCSLGLLVMRHHEGKGALREYTGLKDKNGKEIYEGDILHLDAYGNYTVDYKDVGFETSYIGVVTEGFLSMNDFYDQEDANSYEVIGNIYENPELLEKE